MRSMVFAVLIFCTSCHGHVIGTKARLLETESTDVLTALTLNNEIYGQDRFQILHLRLLDTSEQVIRLLKNGQETATVSLPRTDDEMKNFSLSSLEETTQGFRMTAEWGGGRYFYARGFCFTFKDGAFFLDRIEMRSFDQFTEEQVESEEKVTPAIPIAELQISRFLENR